ncbi:hypothetical protein CEUSTIGMA_g13380.t1 [Chlamydomonas eustigma]|uniref:Uncharacterized protein n=1 Tax=Chlamydomonas eustigma TaxID=1157962 RepID=A0A250XSC4_9CHLO|nr:hypothetical protein CEUSTIGMA_g13380.t1 [Chlamydomonas eustigma]|eukprot:GAX85964.1 hypothetical protein CEUSTIGMA_g13380.t1 [Chlamydomonas eustigma]
MIIYGAKYQSGAAAYIREEIQAFQLAYYLGLKLPSISLSTSSSQHRSLLNCTSEADLDTQPQLTQFRQVSKDSSAGQYNSRCSQGEVSSAVGPKAKYHLLKGPRRSIICCRAQGKVSSVVGPKAKYHLL